jgi:hypothetical protein
VAGKLRASQNARRHGLAAQPVLDSDRLDHIDRLAREIIETMSRPIDLTLARSVAHAELDLRTARTAASTLLAQLSRTEPASDPPPGPRPEWDARAATRTLDDLNMVERYIRRAQAKRDRLIRRCLSDAGE